MALTVFDAVGKFSADTSELDQFIAKLERGIPDASGRAAAATRALKQAQDEFRTSIKSVSVEGGNTAENMQRLADAEKNLTLASAAAKQEHSALRAELTQTNHQTGLMSQAANDLTGKLTSMLGVIASIEGFKALVEGTQRSVLNLELMSEKTGIAIETLSGIEHVSEAAGVSFDDVSTALVRLSRAQVLAIEGGAQQTTAFERIGISVSQLKTLSPEQLFYRVADAMANAKNHAEANASAFALLGRGGAALIPIFQQNTEELKKMVDEAAKNSGVTKEAGDAAREWQAQIANLTETFRAGLIPVMEALVPVIKLVEELGGDTAMVLRNIGAAVGGMGLAVVDNLKGMATSANDLVHGEFRKAAQDAAQAEIDMKHDILGIGDQIKDNYQRNVESIGQIWKKVNPLKPAADDLSDLKGKADDSLKKYQAALLSAQTTLGSAVIELLKQQALQRLNTEEQGYSLETAATKAAFAEQLDLIARVELQKRAIQQKAADDEYQLKLRVLQEQLAVAQAGGKATEAQAVQIASQIEALQFSHQAKLVEIANKGMDALRKAMSQPVPFINEVPAGVQQVENEVTQALDKAEQAAQGLGITLRGDLNSALQKAYDNYSNLDDALKKGVISEADAKNGYIALVRAELDFAQATNASTADVAKLQKQLDQLLGRETTNVDKFGKHWHATFSQMRADMKGGVSGLQELESFGVAAFDSLSASVESAVAAAIMGQESFGEAMKKATAQALASLAAQALVKALFYTAEGFAALASLDFSGAAQFFEAAGIMGAVGAAAAVAGHALAGSSSGNSTSSSGGVAAPGAGSPISTSNGPSGGQNVTHVGTGGIATGRTLAMIGDDASGTSDATEAILPLTDKRAMQSIADAILPGFQKAIGPGLLSAGTVRAAGSGFVPASSSRSDSHVYHVDNSVNVQGIISDDKLDSVMNKMTRRVSTGRAKLLASNSIRVTRRS
jgi:hypothetical protein